MTEIYQVRYKANSKQVLSTYTVVKDGRIVFTCFIVELAWKNNRKSISCIPAKVYDCVIREAGENGSRFNYKHIEILNVPNRTSIKVHIANHYHELEGCQAPGKYAAYDIDKDGELDVVDSTMTLAKLIKVLPKRFKLYIMEKEGLYDF